MGSQDSILHSRGSYAIVAGRDQPVAGRLQCAEERNEIFLYLRCQPDSEPLVVKSSTSPRELKEPL
jgi:hypothetical protein